MASPETPTHVAEMAEGLYLGTFSRRQLLQYAAGVLGAVLIQDQIEGSEALGLTPTIQDWATDLSRTYTPSTYITLVTGFNNKTGNRMREKTSDTLNDVGRYTRLWPGALVEDTASLWQVMEDMYRRDGHTKPDGTIDYARIRQLFIGHSQGGLPVLQLAGVARERGVDVPHITILATPYNQQCVVKDKAWLGLFRFLHEHGLHFGPRARYGVEFLANLTNGETVSDSERMAHNSAWGENSPPNEMLIAQGASIDRGGRRIPTILGSGPATCISYIGAPNDPVVDCRRSSSLFRQEQPDPTILRYTETSPPYRARHAGLDDGDAARQILAVMEADYNALGFPRANVLAQLAREERRRRWME
jgi:hypothetical protein